MRFFHIFNGDSSFSAFQSSMDLEDNFFVVRELLCEGPTSYEFGTEDFWELRKSYLNRFYQIDPKKYAQKIVIPWSSVELDDFEEIVLWFEYDLFCRVNMFCILSFLHQSEFQGIVSVANLEPYQQVNRMVGLGEISPDHYPQIFDSRSILNEQILKFGDDFWQIYCSPDHSYFNEIEEDEFQLLPGLKEAVYFHFGRFPDLTSGLTLIESFIFELLHEKPHTSVGLMKALFHKFSMLGYGDIQYLRIIEGLKKYMVEKNNQFHLNEKGKNILMQKIKPEPREEIFGQCSNLRFSRLNSRIIRNASA